MYEWEGHLYGDFCHIRLPPTGLLFELQQHNVPQKITFFMKIHDYENESTVKVKNLKKVNFTVFTHVT